MKLFILSILLFITNFSFSQNESFLENLKPYTSVSKELIKAEQLYYYEDEYRVYVWVKPSLVKEMFVITYINGIMISQQNIKINQYNNSFEIKKQNTEYTLFIFIDDFNYILQINKRQ